MKTDELIELLATGPVQAGRAAPARRFGLVAGVGLALMSAVTILWLDLRPDLIPALARPAMWGKMGFIVATLAAALWACSRLGQPGQRLGAAAWALAVPLALVWAWAAVELLAADPGERLRLWLGGTWMYCLRYVAILSAPALVLAFWAMRSLAPTRLRLAGAAAGLLAGGVGAAAYALHCPEMAAPFIGTWYVLAMLAPAVAGGLLGPRLLRW